MASSRKILMLLDNGYRPDPRVKFEVELLAGAALETRIVAWDRQGGGGQPSAVEDGRGPEVVRIGVTAASGGGWKTMVALARFSAHVLRERRRLFAGAAVLVVHDIYLLPLGWALARSLRIPFIYDAHEEFARMEDGRYPRALLRSVTALESALARRAEAVIVPGIIRAERWRDAIPRAPIVLPNFVHPREAQATEAQPHWDIAYAGTLSTIRRLDLLAELARSRPDLKIAIAGRGRTEREVMRAVEPLSNVDFLGWQSDSAGIYARARAVYYGLDPRHPYAEIACPNTLYEALYHKRPLVFFCGGDIAALAEEFRIGIRCEPSAAALSTAVDEAVATTAWEFDAAWNAAWDRTQTDAFVRLVEAIVSRA